MHKTIVRVILKANELRQLFLLSQIKDNEHVFVFDIDNTLTLNSLNQPIDRKDPKPNVKMILSVKELILANKKVIFLSARPLREFLSTFNWLQKNKIISKKSDLFLVPDAISKIKYLKILNSNNVEIIYTDDLSYNHENGNILFYEKAIEEVLKIPIQYRGVDFIKNFY